MTQEIEVLSDMLATQTLPAAKILAWSSEIADALANLHRQGLVHGAVTPENVRIASGHAVLASLAAPREGGTVQDDLAQFRELLRSLMVAREPEAAQDATLTELERLSQRYLSADSPAGEMRKAAMALRLLRLERAVSPALPLAVRRPAPTPAKTEKHRMLVLLRVVPPESDEAARRRMAFWPVFWLIVWAAILTTFGLAAVFMLLR